MSSLPIEVLDLVHFARLEALILQVLRDKFPASVPVKSQIAASQTFPFILVRRDNDWGRWQGDARFINTGTLVVHTICDGLNADADAGLLGEAVRNVLVGAVNTVIPELGHLTKVQPIGYPHRVSDWATATGPVQYADLPTGVVRYEASYDLAYKRPTP